MVIAVYIDHNVWDCLFEHRIDLADALPKDEFRLGRNIFYCLTEPSAQAHKEAVNKLYPNEADISLAARSFHSVVSTFDKKKRPL